MIEDGIEVMRAALDLCNAVDTSEQAPRDLSVQSGEVRRKIMTMLQRWRNLVGYTKDHPKRWQDCKQFTDAIEARGYLQAGGVTCMPEGIYIYMYELWQDGRSEAYK